MTQTILIVEDDESIRTTFSEILESEGFQVECFENGLDATQRLENPNFVQPNLIVLDLNMPKMDGLEFLQRSENVGREIPAILLTASNSVIDVLELGREVRIARKPIDLDIFVYLVKELSK